jgi:hypothetical protein
MDETINPSTPNITVSNAHPNQFILLTIAKGIILIDASIAFVSVAS